MNIPENPVVSGAWLPLESSPLVVREKTSPASPIPQGTSMSYSRRSKLVLLKPALLVASGSGALLTPLLPGVPIQASASLPFVSFRSSKPPPVPLMFEKKKSLRWMSCRR